MIKKIHFNKKDQEKEFKKFAKESLYFDLIENQKYNGSEKKLWFKCKKCGNLVFRRFKDVLSNSVICNKCHNGKNLKTRIPRNSTENDFKKIMDSLVKSNESDFEYYSGYKGSMKKCKFKCIKCGNIIERVPSYFLKTGANRKCVICRGNKRGQHLKKENYLESLLKNAIDGKNYEWLEEYKGNNKIKHKMKCLKCKKIFEIRPNDFQQGYRCPHCFKKNKNESSNSRVFSYYLDKYDIFYIKEVALKIKEEDSRDGKKHTLFADYFIPKFNLFIELDGRTHFKFFDKNISNDKSLLDRDFEKNHYFKNGKGKQFKFIRIHYIHFNKVIKEIMKKIIENNGELDKEFCKKFCIYHVIYGKKIYCKKYYENIKEYYSSKI